jgi:D-alanyl-D-alanine carboxypeptidase
MKKMMKVVSVIMLVTGLTWLPENHVAQATSKYYTTDDVRLRSDAGTNYKILLVIKKNTEVTYKSTKGKWIKVSYQNKTGYVYGEYLKMRSIVPSQESIKSYMVNGILVVNKKHPLPSNFAPGESKVARSEFERMKKNAKVQRVFLTSISTYRSFDYQKNLYTNYVKKFGQKEADRFSAKPGYSEHQTGLAFDIGGSNRSLWLDDKFGSEKEGQWLAKNAYKYGYILRYPNGKESITGYEYEPWHFRYVGLEKAKKVFASGKTLEEYLKIK